MSDRKNIFVIHSWEEAPIYERMKDLLAARDAGLADYSLPPWKAVTGSNAVVADRIASRISRSSAVVVLNTPGLHRRPWTKFEMEYSIVTGKRIVVLQPHDDFWRPIPAALDDHLYRVAPWRSDVLGRAIRGEYPQDGRVFDIAEQAERRALVRTLALGIGTASLALLVANTIAFKKLTDELAAQGVRLQWTRAATGELAKFALGGAAIAGGVTALLTKDLKAAAWAAAAGGLAGAAFGSTRLYRAALNGTSKLLVLAVDPV